MKFSLVVFVVALVVLQHIDAKHHHRRHLDLKHNKGKNNATIHQDRDLVSNACNFACTAIGAGMQAAMVPSWKIDLSELISKGLTIAFDAATQSLGIMNMDMKMAAVFSSNIDAFGLFNLATNSGMTINMETGISKCIKMPKPFDILKEGVNFLPPIANLASAMMSTLTSAGGLTSMMPGVSGLFNLFNLMNSFGTRNFLSAMMGMLPTVSNTFQASFGMLLNGMSASATVKGGYNFDFGILNILSSMMPCPGMAFGMLSILQTFITSMDGFANGNMLYQMFSQLATYAPAFLSGKITNFSLQPDMTMAFKASGNASFMITANGLIMVGGEVKGSVADAETILGPLLGLSNIGSTLMQAAMPMATSP